VRLLPKRSYHALQQAVRFDAQCGPGAHLTSHPTGRYLSVNDTFDLNVVIRTALCHQGRITVGAGGAVVALSDPQSEHAEMMLKAERLQTAVRAVRAQRGR
jgi:hypothetical protein